MSVMNWVGVFAIGGCATLGHVTLMKSFRGPMWAAQTGKYVQLLFVVLFGIALFDEIPVFTTLLGAVVVLAAVSYIAFREGRAGPVIISLSRLYLPDDHHRTRQLANLDMSCGFNEADIEFLSALVVVKRHP